MIILQKKGFMLRRALLVEKEGQQIEVGDRMRADQLGAIRRGDHHKIIAADVAGEIVVVATLLEKHQPPNTTAMLFVALGFVVVLALDFIRFRVPSFPFAPFLFPV